MGVDGDEMGGIREEVLGGYCGVHRERGVMCGWVSGSRTVECDQAGSELGLVSGRRSRKIEGSEHCLKCSSLSA